MTKTIDYRTKSIMNEVQNVGVEGYWPIAIDVGYSAVKCFSPNMICAFPSYAKNLGKNPTLYGDQDLHEILYRDGETGEIWRVGRSAQLMIDDRDTSDSQMELYSRERYFSPMFKVLIRTGLALSILNNSAGNYNGKPLMVQTGLPPAYLEDDKDYLIDVIAGHHKFAIKTGKQRSYINMELDILKKNVDVMSQPEGTLMSIAMDDNAMTIPGAKKYFQSRIILCDVGHGTLDLFDIVNRTSHSKETFNEYGMREVLNLTSRKIKERTGVTIRSAAMQNALETGTVTIKKRNGMKISSKTEPFNDLLEEASIQICRDAVEKIMNMYSGLFQYDYLVLTGGTSAAWEPYIKEYFKDVEGLVVVMGNENCPDLDMIFCNVRGYYMYLINTLRRLEKKAR